jgi:hypothetical protein
MALFALTFRQTVVGSYFCQVRDFEFRALPIVHRIQLSHLRLMSSVANIRRDEALQAAVGLRRQGNSLGQGSIDDQRLCWRARRLFTEGCNCRGDADSAFNHAIVVLTRRAPLSTV